MAWVAGLPAFAVEATLVADAHVNSARPDANSGAISNLNVGGGYTSLLQFDLSTLPAGTTATQVSRATLRLYCNRMDTAGLVSVQPVSAGWGEYSVTFTTLPALGAAAQVVQVSQAGAYVAVDVTALVRGWVTAPATNNGIALTAGTAVVQFDSKENDLTGHAAVLDVTLASSGTTGGTGSAGPAGATGPAGPVGATGATGPAGPQGPKGDTGAVGPAGATGPQGPAGAAGLNYQGDYAVGVSYALHDVVTFAGSSYVSLVGNNEANTPGVTSQWAVLAQGSTSGPGNGVGVAYQGDYNQAASYGLNDIVSYQGSSYISLVAGNVGNTPGTSAGPWGVMALGAVGVQGPTGLAGPQGPPGLTGPRGPVGSQGLQGLPGAAGAAGAQGPQGPGVANYTGNYSSTANYALHDAVSFAGSTWISLVAGNLGNTPSSTAAQWALLAAQGPVGAQGPQGPAGVAGADGATGAQGPAGPAGPPTSFQGTWLVGSSYTVGNVVGFGGSSYVAIAANAGREPDLSPTFWALLAQAGTPGAPGAAGPQGPAGAPGAVGVTYRGAWVAQTAYLANDVVTFNGASYLAATTSLGSQPDVSPAQWALLAVNGALGATGPSGTAATVSVGTVTTGPAGLEASVTNSGTANAAVLNFMIPQGAPGVGGSGTGGGGTSGIPFASLYHAVSFNFSFYSVNSANSSASESDSVLTWVPSGCSATQLSVFSRQSNSIRVILRQGTPGNMVDTGLACSVASGSACTTTGNVAIAAGNFVDFSVSGASGTAAGVWMALACN